MIFVVVAEMIGEEMSRAQVKKARIYGLISGAVATAIVYLIFKSVFSEIPRLPLALIYILSLGVGWCMGPRIFMK